MSALGQRFHSLLPSRQDYRGLRRSWRGDLVAGLTVGIVALPLALAFGVSSGAGAEAGLITAIVAGLVAAVFGGSHLQVSGPTGAMVVVLAPIVHAHGVAAVALVSIMAGAIVLIAGVLRWGRTVSYLPWPVIEGFTAGIGVIIFLQQVPAAFGSDIVTEHSSSLLAAIEAVSGASWPQALIPLALVAVVAAAMLAVPARWQRVPGSFIAIVVVTVAAMLLALPVQTIGELPSSLPAPALPYFDWALFQELLLPAGVVAALAAIESLLSVRVAAGMNPAGAYLADRELVGQGLASIASGFFGGIPATGAIARTAVNIRSGARTRVAAIVHSVALLGVVYLASGAVEHIPLAALAGVLMVTAFRMISIGTARRVIGASRSDALVYLLTAVVTVSFDLVVAVGIGIAVAAFFALRSLSRSSRVVREPLPGPVEAGDERIALYHVEGSLFFGVADQLDEQLSGQTGLEVLILRLSTMQVLDASGAESLAVAITRLEREGITVLVKGVRAEHWGLLERVGVLGRLRHPSHLFRELEPAVAHARSHVQRAAAAADSAEPPSERPG